MLSPIAQVAGCAICGSPLRPILGRLAFIARSAYQLCPACGLLQSHPDVDEETRFYREDYHRLPHKEQEAAGRLGLFRAGLLEIRRRAAGGRLLDVGCGEGHFLELARAAGFEAEGVELGGELAGRAAARSGCRVQVGGVGALPPESRFDVITLWNVLDQVPAPRQLLDELRQRLRPDGLLFLRVPNGSVHRVLMHLAAILGPRSRQLGLASLTPFHPYLLRPRDLRGLLDRSGFRLEYLRGSRPTERSGGPGLQLARLGARALAQVGDWGSAKGLLLSPSLEAFAVRVERG